MEVPVPVHSTSLLAPTGDPWTTPVDALLRDLDSKLDGLSEADAAGRREVVRPGGGRVRPVLRLFVRQFTSPIIIILIAATVVSVVLSDPIDGLIILIIIIASGLLGFFQEWRASVAMRDLVGRTRVHADVLRDGREHEVRIEDVVVGDVVVLRAGDIVPADLRILRSECLLVDESAITGESTAREKAAEEQAPSDRGSTSWPRSALFFGSHVVSGTAVGVVVAVGRRTRFGALVEHLESADVRTKFEKEMASFGYLLVRIVAVLVTITVIINLFLRRPVFDALMFALAIAVGITPQLLPAIVSISLAAGARRMASGGVLVKRLDAIEDIGGMSVLCCDKTGTLTEGVVQLQTARTVDGRESDRVLRLAAVNASLQSGYPNPLDNAILAKSGDIGGSIIDEVPYDFERRRLSVLVDDGDGEVLVTKGAFASILAVSSHIRVGDVVVPLDEDHRSEVQAAFEKLSGEGLRVLAIATRAMPAARAASTSDEAHMTLEGLLGFADPPTEQARRSLEALHGLGIEVVLITGDNPFVARKVAREVGLDASTVLIGERIATMSAAQLQEATTRVRVFAEVDPLQKEALVRAFQRAGASVGFLGDGINDSAALRAADVGVSVDGAADAAKHAADLVVMTKDLGVVAQGVVAGRRTFSNTLKYIRVTISANFGNMISLVVASALLPFLPLLPVQILMLNLLSDVPAVTIASDRVDEQEIHSPRMWSLPALRRFMIVFGVASSIIDLSAFALLFWWLDASQETFQSAWFTLSIATECLALLILRSGLPFWRTRPSALLAISCVVVIVVGFALPFLPVAAWVGLLGVPVGVMVLVVALAIAYVVVNEGTKVLWGRRRSWNVV